MADGRATPYRVAESQVYHPGDNHQEDTLPKGTPRTDAEKRADELLDSIEGYMRELRRLVSAGADAQRRLEKVKAELGYTGANGSALQPEPVWPSES